MSEKNVVEKNEAKVKNGVEYTSAEKLYSPKVDIFETEQELLVFADMPGVDENNVDIQLEDNELTIYGRASEDRMDGFNIIHREYPVGGYRRVFSVHDFIDKENIKATVKNGELCIVLPKSVPLSKKISVSAT